MLAFAGCRHTGEVHALSPRNRLLAVVGAVESGIALSYFTHGHIVDGLACTVGVAFLTFVYFSRQRKLKRGDGGRRY
jgi:hypothetical protein